MGVEQNSSSRNKSFAPSDDALEVLRQIANQMRKAELVQSGILIELREVKRALEDLNDLLDDVMFFADQVGKAADDNDGEITGLDLANAMKAVRAKRDEEIGGQGDEGEEEEEAPA